MTQGTGIPLRLYPRPCAIKKTPAAKCRFVPSIVKYQKEVPQVTKTPQVPTFKLPAHRSCRLNSFTVGLILKARAANLTYAEIADFLKVSERSLYRWIDQGRQLWMAIDLFATKAREELSFSDQAKLELYEGIWRKAEDVDAERVISNLDEHIQTVKARKRRGSGRRMAEENDIIVLPLRDQRF